ncbi:MAG TPA: DUF397 domain-containing protein [Streptosporangiaceae bacterium]
MPAAGLEDVEWQSAQHDARVEMALLPEGSIAMRNAQHPGGPALIYTHAEIAAFIAGAKDGDFDDLLELVGCGTLS